MRWIGRSILPLIVNLGIYKKLQWTLRVYLGRIRLAEDNFKKFADFRNI